MGAGGVGWGAGYECVGGTRLGIFSMTLVVVLVERGGGCQGATHRVNPVHLNFHHLTCFWCANVPLPVSPVCRTCLCALQIDLHGEQLDVLKKVQDQNSELRMRLNEVRAPAASVGGACLQYTRRIPMHRTRRAWCFCCCCMLWTPGGGGQHGGPHGFAGGYQRQVWSE